MSGGGDTHHFRRMITIWVSSPPRSISSSGSPSAPTYRPVT
jgi:hypothetical protein